MTCACIHCQDYGVGACDAARCDAADPALPWDRQTAPKPCRPCFVRLGGIVDPAPPVSRSPLPCVHLGAETGERRECPSCTGKVEVKLRACAVHGSCTTHKPLDGVACCAACPDHAPDTFSLVAPVGTRGGRGPPWEGRTARKPWQYRVTAILPHLEAPEYLEACVALLRLQTERPYLVVVDTGSPPDVCGRLERMRAEDLEVHFVRGGGYTHSSEPVAVALDLGMARVNTGLIFLTHIDCFPLRRDAVAWLAAQCSALVPVVGWEMSPRPWATDKWRGMVSHTFTVVHSETARRKGLTWHMQRGRDLLGLGLDYHADGWPDTETAFNMTCRNAGVSVRILGPEPNFERHQTPWFDHARSVPGLRAYNRGTAMQLKAEAYGTLALAEARARVAAWQATPTA